MELALTRHGFSLADIRGLTLPEARAYIELLAEAATGKNGAGAGRRIVNQRRNRRG